MRGDDVGTLQCWLGRLGFDCGRVDGISGRRRRRPSRSPARLRAGSTASAARRPSAPSRSTGLAPAPDQGWPRSASSSTSAPSGERWPAPRRRRPVRRPRGPRPPHRPGPPPARRQGDHRRRARPVVHAATDRYAATVYAGFEPLTEASPGSPTTPRPGSSPPAAGPGRPARAGSTPRRPPAAGGARHAPAGPPGDVDDGRRVLAGPVRRVVDPAPGISDAVVKPSPLGRRTRPLT